MLFDAAKRRVCEVRVIRTNTPLHALTLMNDTAFVEASRALAARAMTDAESHASRINILVERILARLPKDDERRILDRQWNKAKTYYTKNSNAAKQLASHGVTLPNEKLNPTKLAAYTIIATLLFNLDEAITRE